MEMRLDAHSLIVSIYEGIHLEETPHLEMFLYSMMGRFQEGDPSFFFTPFPLSGKLVPSSTLSKNTKKRRKVGPEDDLSETVVCARSCLPGTCQLPFTDCGSPWS